ncbi:MAG TPA: hypothetical protein VFV43_10340 [Limnobacter sp.]|nr:hypothetical protein [Limnobacter sp.]
MTPHRRALASFSLCIVLLGQNNTSLAQQLIPNPLVKPQPRVTESTGTTTERESASATQAGSPEGDAVRKQASVKINQEDFNLSQQRLNSPVVPAPLLALFANMQVTAVMKGAVVLRKIDSTTASSPAINAVPQGPSNPGREAAPPPVQVPQVVKRSSAVLRLQSDRTENVNGYTLRAKVSAQDVVVDWLSDSGVWINVYFAALESSSPAQAQIPNPSELLSVQTEDFNYLVPKLQTRTFSANPGQGGLNNNNPFGGAGFNSGFGGQPFNQPGFGTSVGF